MWVAQVARGEGASWARLGASATLAAMTHAAVVLALPTHPSVAPTPTELLEVIAFDLRSEPEGAIGDGQPASATPIASAQLNARQTPTRRTLTRRTESLSPPKDTNEFAPTDATQTSAPMPSIAQGVGEVSEAGDESDGSDGASAGGVSEGPGGSGSGVGIGRGSGAQGTGSGARLLGNGDPCAGYFPAASSAARARVSITVEVDARGIVTGSEILEVNPSGAGFAQAAQACVSRLRFAAATTPQGQAIKSRTTLRLLFQRTE